MTKLYAINISKGIEPKTFAKLLQYVSKEKQERIKKIISNKDALRSLIGDILIRYIICRKFSILNENIVFEVNEYGKPSLKNFKDFYFNISHAGDWVVCVVGESDVGVDVELVKDIELNIANSFFSTEEYQDLMLQPEEERVDYFYELWTLKESYIKAVGKGLSMPLNSFYIVKNNNVIKVVSKNNPDNFCFKQYFLDSKHKLAICVHCILNTPGYTFSPKEFFGLE